MYKPNVRSGDSRELEALDNGGERVYILEDRRILKGRRPQELGDYISYLLSRDPYVTRWLPVGKPTLIPRLHHGDPDTTPEPIRIGRRTESLHRPARAD